MATKKSKNVVIWTKSRPWTVVHGELVSRKGDTAILRNARMAVYWSTEVRGVLGLGIDGPVGASRVTRRAEALEIGGVEGLVSSTPEADRAWEAEPWR